MVQITEALKRESLRIEEDSIHSAKSHFNAAKTWSTRHYGIGIPATILGAAAGAAAVKSCPELAGLLALLGTILTGLLTFLKPSERASAHKTAGDQYLALRNDARVFREISLHLEGEAAANADHLKALSDRRNELNQGSPEVPRHAFETAKQGIDAGEATYKTDKEP
jgi:hypothetical protein